MKYILANWKMYPTVDAAVALLLDIKAGLVERARSRGAQPRVIICPPSVSLVALRAVADDGVVALGAQNCHWEQEGGYTGEVSARMLQGLVDYVMVGHSERRARGETDDQIARKVAAVVAVGLTPILFVGEDARDDDAVELTEHRLRRGLSAIDVRERRVLVVYEPSWAIGGADAAAPEHVGEVVGHIKSVLHELGTGDACVLYGGSIGEQNVEAFARLDVLDGVGATRASLDGGTFLAMVDRFGSLAGLR